MFVKTDLQRSLLECEFLLPAEKAERLRKSWAHPFRERVLPLIDEEVFRGAYSEDNGRPNKSIRLMVALHLLKEWDDLTDEQVLSQLEYNLQWHYALYLESEETHTCQKTLHNFRVKLMENKRARQLFEKVTRALAEADGVSFGRQRLDSTHVLSNIAVLTRLGLFVETVTHFLKELRKEAPAAFASLRPGYVQRYLDREGYFSDAKREQARRRLKVVAEDVYALVSEFEEEPAVSALRSFEKLVRLFEEQCEVVEACDGDGCDEDGDGEQSCSSGKGRLRARVIDPKEVASNSLQSPHDPDATYGHKGKGYEARGRGDLRRREPVSGHHEHEGERGSRVGSEGGSADARPTRAEQDDARRAHCGHGLRQRREHRREREAWGESPGAGAEPRCATDDGSLRGASG
jgi:hypothetical protein